MGFFWQECTIILDYFQNFLNLQMLLCQDPQAVLQQAPIPAATAAAPVARVSPIYRSLHFPISHSSCTQFTCYVTPSGNRFM